MEVFWGVFFIAMANILINAYVLNQVVKDRKVLANFVEAAKIYANAFEYVGVKQNELISMVNKHSDLLQVLTDQQPEIGDAARAARTARRSPKKRRVRVEDRDQNSTDTA